MKNNTYSKCPVCNGEVIKKISHYYGKTSFFRDKKKKLLNCPKCDLVFMDPMPTDAQLDKFYNTYWVNENSVQSSSADSLKVYYAESLSRLEYLQNRVGSLRNKTILDFGAGYGLFGEVIEENEKDVKYYAVEADKKIVEQLLSKGIDAATKIEELEQLEFDIIVVFHVLEHLVDPKEFIRQLLKHLKKNGVLFIEVPNQDYLWKRNFEPHILFFNEPSLEVLFKSLSLSNFEILSCGRKLQNIPNERRKSKILRHIIGKTIRYFGLLRPKENINNSKDVKTYREIYEMDSFGANKQWLRAIIQKTN